MVALKETYKRKLQPRKELIKEILGTSALINRFELLNRRNQGPFTNLSLQPGDVPIYQNIRALNPFRPPDGQGGASERIDDANSLSVFVFALSCKEKFAPEENVHH